MLLDILSNVHYIYLTKDNASLPESVYFKFKTNNPCQKITHFHTKTHLNQHKTVFFLSFSQRKLVFAIKSEFYVR